jgi:hypothetical protein
MPGVLLLAVSVLRLLGDDLETVNGEKYVGRVGLVTDKVVVFQSDTAGKITLPREKVASLSMRQKAPERIAAGDKNGKPVRAANESEIESAVRDLKTNNLIVRQVQNQLLAQAGPEANQKFNELLSGLMSGSLSVQDLRAEAKSIRDQVQSLRKELGEEEGGWALDGYLSILDRFINQAPGTNSPSEKKSRELNSRNVWPIR